MISELQTTENIEPAVIVETRVGEITVTPLNEYTFMGGLYGFKEFKEYALVPMPNFPEEHSYMVMHALDSNDLTFIVKPIGVGGIQDEILNKEKLYTLVESKGLKVEEQMFGVFVVIDDSLPKGSRACLNADAPLVFNLRDLTGIQVILD